MIDILLGDITDGRDAFHRLFAGCSLVAPRNSGQDGNENDDDDGGQFGPHDYDDDDCDDDHDEDDDDDVVFAFLLHLFANVFVFR